MRVAPAASEPRLRLGKVLSQLGRTRDALQVWTEAAGVAPNAIAIHEALADCLLGLGDFKAARAEADLVRQARPGDPRALLVAALAELGHDPDSALDASPTGPQREPRRSPPARAGALRRDRDDDGTRIGPRLVREAPGRGEGRAANSPKSSLAHRVLLRSCRPRCWRSSSRRSRMLRQTSPHCCLR